MTAGHLNPGYGKIVTRNTLALSNPNCDKKLLNSNELHLETIKSKARNVWSTKDSSETTYGFYFSDPLIKDREALRPSSPTRRNNPHPKK